MKANQVANLLEQKINDLITLSQVAMKEILDDIGRDSVNGMVGLSKYEKNNNRILAIRTGNLYRSLVKGTDSNSIRKISTSNNVITGTIGSKAKSKNGFFYPTFHEYGGSDGTSRFAGFLKRAVENNEQNLRDKLIKKIGQL